MEDDGACNNTDTIPIPMLDVERRTVPVICPWCNAIDGIARMEVGSSTKISPVYMICEKCLTFVKEGSMVTDSRHVFYKR